MDDKLIVIYRFTWIGTDSTHLSTYDLSTGDCWFPLFLNVVVCITLFEEVLL